MALGKTIPNFTIEATNGKKIQSAELKGHNVVLYFYPKDCTPGCTLESETFRDFHKKFQQHNTLIFGISRDSIKSHENFKSKYQLPFELLSDHNEALCELFDVIKMKNMYGKQVRGIERSTFLLNTELKLVKEWRKVKVPGHVEEVLSAVKELSNSATLK
ncbi:MAG: peroxiredoxin [Legionellales bacterium]|nr:peroxiredoxin [Legionellales bacterium]